MGRKTPHQTGDHGLTPVDPTGAEGLTRVEACLHVGDFPAATHAWHPVEASGWLAHVSGVPRTDLTRLRAVAIAAELAFAHGQPQAAQAVLADYLAHPDDFLAPDNGLSVHAKLQLAEWYYARRESAIAVHLAERLLAACDPEGYAAEGRVPARYASVRPYLEDSRRAPLLSGPLL